MTNYDPNQKRKKKLTTRLPGEDPYAFVIRTMNEARPHEQAWLYMIRHGDDKQQETMRFLAEAKVAYWTRFAVIFAALSLPISVIAALIARS
ncbi:MAG: hypothetical protein ABL953_04470 [Ilumatobacteraceae bacterium]